MAETILERSILDTIKKALAVDPSYDAFDEEIMMHINSVFSILHQIGATPPGGFVLITGQEKWNEYLLDVKNVAMVKSYIFLKVKLLFDATSLTSFTIDAFQKQISEFESRLSYEELNFNPAARDFATPPETIPATAWLVGDDLVFPSAMRSGELALNPTSGEVWRKP